MQPICHLSHLVGDGVIPVRVIKFQLDAAWSF